MPHPQERKRRRAASSGAHTPTEKFAREKRVAQLVGSGSRCSDSIMRWDRNYSSSNIEDRSGEVFSGGGGLGAMGGGGAFGLIRILSMFGWKGILIGLVLVAIIAGGGTCLGGGQGCALGGGGGQPSSGPVKSSAEEDEIVKFVGYVFDDVQNTWAKTFDNYEVTHIVLFRNGTQSACGTATTAVGPFYCPLDHKVYIDLAFYDELRSRFGAPGDFAEAYVIAHELGHHVQNLRNRLNKTSAGVEQIAVELQADCMAGAWARDAEKRGLLEVGDVDEALNAASQIGDDTLQRKSGREVQPETWTHGSSAQRSASFKKGYQGGPQACNI
jgi:predicted metalloprotease